MLKFLFMTITSSKCECSGDNVWGVSTFLFLMASFLLQMDSFLWASRVLHKHLVVFCLCPSPQFCKTDMLPAAAEKRTPNLFSVPSSSLSCQPVCQWVKAVDFSFSLSNVMRHLHKAKLLLVLLRLKEQKGWANEEGMSWMNPENADRTVTVIKTWQTAEIETISWMKQALERHSYTYFCLAFHTFYPFSRIKFLTL